MAVLLVYCLRDFGVDLKSVAIPKMSALVVVVISYKWKHNVLLSISLGTAGYMLFLNLLK